jgi:hypothetical protein
MYIHTYFTLSSSDIEEIDIFHDTVDDDDAVALRLEFYQHGTISLSKT